MGHAHSIHFFTKFVRGRNSGRSPEDALARTMHESGAAMTITTVVLIIGFGSLLLSDFKPNFQMGTLARKITDPSAIRDPNHVKVVFNRYGAALYFSRSPIPGRSHQRAGNGHNAESKRHVGVYAFRPAALRDFCALPEGQLELDENLEQLRWLEAGRSLRVLRAKHAPGGIDTREDYLAFVARQSNSLSNPPTA